MKTVATLSRTCAAKALLGAAALALSAAPLAAQDGDDGEETEKPVTDDTVTAGDVAVTPIEDLNLKKDDIPPLLLAAQQDPYSTAGLRRCSQYAAAVLELDAVLGTDFDLASQEERKMTVGSVAKSVVGALIPFRGVIREISGAAEHERDFQDAILAGVMRRAFLKGMGLKLGCAYPARPADAAAKAAYAARIEAEKAEDEKDDDN